MFLPRSPIILLPCAVVLLTAIGGCSHPLEVDVPAAYHGHVTIPCEQLDRMNKPIHVDMNGIAEKAVCPRSQTSLVVVRGGSPVQPGSPPRWGFTDDGIVLSIELDVP